MNTRRRILTKDGSTTAYLVWGQNHLLQKRQFAYDGVKWYYQPSVREKFIQVNTMDVPENVIRGMSIVTGFPKERLQS
jgi:hypothetical protein